MRENKRKRERERERERERFVRLREVAAAAPLREPVDPLRINLGRGRRLLVLLSLSWL